MCHVVTSTTECTRLQRQREEKVEIVSQQWEAERESRARLDLVKVGELEVNYVN